jgi:hypothetical protein
MKTNFFCGLLVRGALLAALLGASAARAQEILHHVHGLSFTADGAALMVPSHVGLAVYRHGKGWTRAPGPGHDYMGFSVAQEAMYSSGHPAPGSPLRDPFGLIKSTNGGTTWQQLGLAGEADFHLMAAGWRSKAVYVINEHANSKMPRPGLYVTRDDGKSWVRAAANGVESQVIAVAAHPVDPAVVALGTVRGLMLSRDSGQSFRRLGRGEPATAVAFEYSGKHVLYAEPGEGSLLRLTLGADAPNRLKMPALGKDFVTFIAQNPTNAKELAFATRNRHVFVTTNGGGSWQQIARAGRAH